MPGIVRNYKAGSVIYFMGDVGDSIYILKAGLVSLTYHSIETGEEVRENIQKGEFFGVKSALAKRPREETATVLKDAQALVLTTEEFEKLITSNITIITNAGKALLFFSTTAAAADPGMSSALRSVGLPTYCRVRLRSPRSRALYPCPSAPPRYVCLRAVFSKQLFTLLRAPRRTVEYACGALSRAPCIHARLRRLDTKPCEKCGFERN